MNLNGWYWGLQLCRAHGDNGNIGGVDDASNSSNVQWSLCQPSLLPYSLAHIHMHAYVSAHWHTINSAGIHNKMGNKTRWKEPSWLECSAFDYIRAMCWCVSVCECMFVYVCVGESEQKRMRGGNRLFAVECQKRLELACMAKPKVMG